MTPKEKAKDLVDKYIPPINSDWDLFDIDQAKQCALIAADECINLHFNLESDRNGIGESFKYWQEVKTEIEKL
jgi:hypothetical protein